MKYEMKLNNGPFEQIKNGTIEYPRQNINLSEEEIKRIPIGDYFYCRHTVCYSPDYSSSINSSLKVLNKYIKYDYDGNIAYIGKIPIIVENTNQGLKDLITGRLLNDTIHSDFIGFKISRRVPKEELLRILNTVTDSDRNIYEANLNWLCMELSNASSQTIVQEAAKDRTLKLKLNEI